MYWRVLGIVALAGLNADLKEAITFSLDGRRTAGHDQAETLMHWLGEVVVHRRQELFGSNTIMIAVG